MVVDLYWAVGSLIAVYAIWWIVWFIVEKLWAPMITLGGAVLLYLWPAHRDQARFAVAELLIGWAFALLPHFSPEKKQMALFIMASWMGSSNNSTMRKERMQARNLTTLREQVEAKKLRETPH